MKKIPIKLPDGTIVEKEFPDSMSKEEISAVIQMRYGQPKEQEGSNLKRYGLDIPIGIAKAGESIGNIPSDIEESLFSGPSRLFGKVNLGSKNLEQYQGIPEGQKNIADELLQLGPQFGAALAAPPVSVSEKALSSIFSQIPKLEKYAETFGKYAKPAIGNALTQALVSMGFADKDRSKSGAESGAMSVPFSVASQMVLSGNPITRNLARLSLGSGGALAGYAGAKAAHAPDSAALLASAILGGLGLRGVNPKGRAQERALEGIKGFEPEALENLGKSRELGLSFMSPAEASQSRYAAGIEGSFGRTKEEAQILDKAYAERVKSEKGAIKKFLDTISNPTEHAEAEKKLYEMSKSKMVPPEKLIALRNNEIFKKAEKLVANDVDYQQKLKGVPKDSVEYLDIIKRKLDGMVFKAKQGGDFTKAAFRDEVRKDLLNTIDTLYPDYQKARSLAERRIARRSLENFFKRKTASMNGPNFARFLSNEKNYESLNHSLRDVPAAQQQLELMRDIFPKLMNNITSKTARGYAKTGVSKSRSTAEALHTKIEHFLSGDYGTAATELITNPKWEEELFKLKKINNNEEFIGKAIDLFGKAYSQEASK